MIKVSSRRPSSFNIFKTEARKSSARGRIATFGIFAAFLTDYAKIPVAMAGIVLMVTSIFDIIWVPTAGVILECSIQDEKSL